MAIELSKYLQPEDIIKMSCLSKKCHQVYSQDIIWWVYLYTSFPQFRCAENFLFEDKKDKLVPYSAMRAYSTARRHKISMEKQDYKVTPRNHFMVYVQGLLGKLPKSEDIQRTVGDNFDLLSAFQTYFLFEDDIYALTTYSCPSDKYSAYMMNEIDCFLILGNESLYFARKDCESMHNLI